MITGAFLFAFQLPLLHALKMNKKGFAADLVTDEDPEDQEDGGMDEGAEADGMAKVKKKKKKKGAAPAKGTEGYQASKMGYWKQKGLKGC